MKTYCLSAFSLVFFLLMHTVYAQSQLEFFIPECEKPNSIFEKHNEIDLNIHPNPFTGSFIINYALSKTSNGLNIEIYDVVGSLIKTIYNHTEDNIHVDMAEYSSGIYFLKITDGENNYFRKIVKQN